MNSRKQLPPLLFSCFLLSLALPSLALGVNGVAVYQYLNNDIYLAALKLEAPSSDAAAIMDSTGTKAIELRFIKGMSKRRWANNWLQSIAINSPREDFASSVEDISNILSAFSGVLVSGDIVEFYYSTTTGTSIRLNGKELTSIPSVKIFNLFLSTMIGPVPPSSQFKNAILGINNSQELQNRFQQIQPSANRTAETNTWLSAAKKEAIAAKEKAEQEAEKAERANLEQEKFKQLEKDQLAEQEKIRVEAEKASKLAAIAAEDAAIEASATEGDSVTKPAATDAATNNAVTETAQSEETLNLSAESILAQQNYTTEIIKKIYKKVQYPNSAVRRKYEGSVRAALTLNRKGSIVDLLIIQSSTFNSLDKEVLKAIKRATPFPKIPAQIRGETIELVIPVNFKL